MDHQDLRHQDTGPSPRPQEGGVGINLELELSVVFGVAVLCLISFLIYIYLAKRQVSGARSSKSLCIISILRLRPNNIS